MDAENWPNVPSEETQKTALHLMSAANISLKPSHHMGYRFDCKFSRGYGVRRWWHDNVTFSSALACPTEKPLRYNPKHGPWHLCNPHTWVERNQRTKDNTPCNPVRGLRAWARTCMHTHTAVESAVSCVASPLTCTCSLTPTVRLNAITQTAVNVRNLHSTWGEARPRNPFLKALLLLARFLP